MPRPMSSAPNASRVYDRVGRDTSHSANSEVAMATSSDSKVGQKA